MTTNTATPLLTDSEWGELVALKDAINTNPASVRYDRMERFTDLMVKSLRERGG